MLVFLDKGVTSVLLELHMISIVLTLYELMLDCSRLQTSKD
jgi:hypothetical protein